MTNAPSASRTASLEAVDAAALRYLRALAAGDESAIDDAKNALRDCPGRAAGRVAAWSLARTFEALRRYARRPLRWGVAGEAPTPHERSLFNVAAALAKGDENAARAAAQWIATPQGENALLQRLAPAAQTLSRAA